MKTLMDLFAPPEPPPPRKPLWVTLALVPGDKMVVVGLGACDDTDYRGALEQGRAKAPGRNADPITVDAFDVMRPPDQVKANVRDWLVSHDAELGFALLTADLLLQELDRVKREVLGVPDAD